MDYISGNGIKVADEASSVGLGWNLGMPTIVQSVLGMDDLDTNVQKLKIALHYQSNTPWGVMNSNEQYLETKDGAPIPSGYVQNPEIGKYTYYYSTYHTLPVNGFFHSYSNWLKYDSSPDMFTLNLFGEKVEFFISNHENVNSADPIFTCLKKGYVVKYTKGSNTFKITNPQGITYEFGKSENVKILGMVNRNFVLTKVYDKNQKTLEISYNEYSDILNFIPQSRNLNYNRGRTSTTSPGCGGVSIYYGGQYSWASKFRPPNLQEDAYLTSQTSQTYFVSNSPAYYGIQNYLLVSKISGSFGSVEFSYTNRDDFPTGKLDAIQVKNSSNIVKNIDFEYEYSISNNNNFQNPDTSNLFSDDRMKKRLFLKNMKVNQLENYKFSYYSQQLPRKDSYAVDYWGYYNGGLNNKTYFAKPTDFSITYLSQLPITDQNNNVKTADQNFAIYGLLSRITYPTQGYSLFTYELNTANNLFSTYNPSLINKGKGVRLESQANYDSNMSLLEKTKFIYENGYSTNPLDLVKEYINKKYSGGQYDTYTIISINSTNNYSASILSSGDNVGYEKVSKIQVDQVGHEKGRIISNYNLNPDVFYQFWQDQLPVSIPATKNTGIESGKLISQTITNANNEKLKETINEYETRYSDIYYGSIFSPISEYLYICKTLSGTGGINPDPSSIRDLSVVAHYPIFSKESLLSKSTITEYFNDGGLTTQVSYLYDSNNFVSNKSTLIPSATQISENYVYSSQIPKLLQANILSDNIEKKTYQDGKQVFNQVTKYDNANHLNPTSVQTYDISNNNIAYTEATYNLYDNKGNLLQYTTKEGIPITIIWGYNKTQPIAKIEGATYSQVMQAFGLNGNSNEAYLQLDIVKKSDLDIDDLTESSLILELDNFRKNSVFSSYQVSTYTYNPLIGVTSITPPSGIREIYKYDSLNRLDKIVDINNNILKDYKYNYAPIHFYNSAISQTFTRNNCGSNSVGGTYTYTVPENQYSSIISQADADQQAQNDMNSNGQSMANTNGSCTVLSCTLTKGSGINIFNYGSIGLANSTNYRIQMGFVYQSNLAWDTGVVIGKIYGNCIPSELKTSSTYFNGVWFFTIDTNGNITAKITSASPSLINNMNIVLDFTYTTN